MKTYQKIATIGTLLTSVYGSGCATHQTYHSAPSATRIDCTDAQRTLDALEFENLFGLANSTDLRKARNEKSRCR